ncbi:MAG: class I SAM-dependent methyltransferase, partial [Myxococcales bacterium]|nr:class I SAM-dependent methyltransferase [Myxococcales bacterium]
MAALSVHEPVPASHPDHLWVAATRRGLRPAPPEGARVLEIACGDGSNLLPMAFHRPDARFVGLEGGPAVRAAQDGARRLGLSNVTFVAGDLDAIRARGERYDYVIVHGVLSHVSDAARAATFALAAAVLEPSGVLYVDHLGRSARMVEARLRDLVRRRVGPLPTVAERITAMRAILDALEEVPPTPDRPHAVTARVEVTYARGLSDAALVQHFLTPHRHGIAPSELAALAARHGLAPFDEGWDPSPERHAEQRTEAQ